MEQHGTEQGGQERRPREPAVDRGEGRPCRHRDDRHGIGERSEDLPDRPGPAPKVRPGAEPAVVRQSDRAIARLRVSQTADARDVAGAAEHRDCLDRPAAGRLGGSGIQRGRRGELVDLAVLLEYRLEERQSETRFGVEGKRLGGNVLAGPAQHERVEQLVGDEVAGRGVVLGPPGGGDPVAQLGLEAGPAQRHVGQDRHHVDHERLALGPVERLETRGVDEREQVPRCLDGSRVATHRRGRLPQALEDPA